MEGNYKKKITPDLDEEALMNLMVDGVKKEGLKISSDEEPTQKRQQEKVMEEAEKEKPVKRDRSRTKGISTAEYEEIFFSEVKTTARHGKSVYIDPNHHKKLSRIIQVIGDDNITIYAYLSNLLDHHFKEFEQQITESFNEKNKPIF
mgnify:CR=1 FL=1